jgi:hypothetical protein
MSNQLPLLVIVLSILTIFTGRTLIARMMSVPRLFELLDTIIVLGSLLVLIREHRILSRRDWAVGVILGILVAAGMYRATLFTPYPFFGIINIPAGQAIIRGTFTTLAVLGGLAAMRKSGPILFRMANGGWHKSASSLLFGLSVGLPLAGLNVFALHISEGQPISWQNPFAAILDGLQPALVEETIYRFAFLGLLWLALRKSLPKQAIWISGCLAMLVHNYAHLSDLFVDAPLRALGMGAVMSLLWGLPLTILAICRDLESAVGFHWIQDIARFLTGF